MPGKPGIPVVPGSPIGPGGPAGPTGPWRRWKGERHDSELCRQRRERERELVSEWVRVGAKVREGGRERERERGRKRGGVVVELTVFPGGPGSPGLPWSPSIPYRRQQLHPSAKYQRKIIPYVLAVLWDQGDLVCQSYPERAKKRNIITINHCSMNSCENQFGDLNANWWVLLTSLPNWQNKICKGFLQYSNQGKFK